MPEAEREVMRQAVRRPEAALIVRLLHQTSGRVLNLANLHVAWMDLKAPALQALQVMATLAVTLILTLTVTLTVTLTDLYVAWMDLKALALQALQVMTTLTVTYIDVAWT